jgi:ribonuclease P protein component
VVGRVRDRATFGAFRSSRRRVRRGPITVTFVPGAPTDPPRVAYAIGRKVGGAVVRNRLRRRLRAAVAELGPVLRPGAYLVGATAEAVPLSFGELQAIMSEAVQALGAEQRDRGTPPVDR